MSRHFIALYAFLFIVAPQAAFAQSQSSKAGDLVIESPWLRATPRGASVVGGYVKITNKGKAADRLIGGSVEGAKRFEIHEMAMVNNVMHMRPLPNGIEIKPGETVELKPGGLHIMGLDLAAGYRAGESVKGTLRFEKAGTVPVTYSIQPIGAGPPAGMKH